MPDNKIKAVLFDLGETLLNFGKVKTTSLFRQGARLSYDYLKSMGQPVGNFECYCWRNLASLRLHHIISNFTGNDFNSLALLRGIGTKRGVRLDKEQWRQFAWYWYEPLARTAQIDPNTIETLESLKKMGLQLGIVSNTFVNACSLEQHLKQFGILDFFSVRIYSYQLNFRKPDLRIFKIAAEKIGHMLQNIMFVGDRIDKDINGALKSGMYPVLKTAYTNSGKETPKGAWKIDLLSELPALIDKINTSNDTQSTSAAKTPVTTNSQESRI